jgi:hypothetical protein
MKGFATGGLFVPGRDSALRSRGAYPGKMNVSPGYFEATGVRVLAGRGFTYEDRAGTEPVMVVSREIADAAWPGDSPIGRCLVVGKPGDMCRRIVGVVEDTHLMRLIERSAPQFYLPIAQTPETDVEAIVVRTDGGHAAALASVLRRELSSIIPDAGNFEVQTMAAAMVPELRPWRMGAILFSSLGVLATIVACVGIYGVIAYRVAQRTREMGVRIAIGAQTSDILNLVLAGGVRDAGLGIAIGIIAALLLGRLVRSLLFGVIPQDAGVFSGAIAVIALFAGLACLVPGWRAARVDPVGALRSD